MGSRRSNLTRELPVAWILTWIPAAALTVLLLVSRDALRAFPALLLAIPSAAMLASICQSSQFLVRGQALTPTRRLGTGATVALASSVVGATFSASVCVLWSFAVDRPVWSDIPGILWLGGAVAYSSSALHYVAQQAQRAAERAAQEGLRDALRAREAELAALSARVNPHFLFNSLTSIAALTSRDAEGARRMCLDLADLLRERLSDVNGKVALAEELETVRLYLSIERVRFAERLEVEQDVPSELSTFEVPALILQPLVENAIQHGIAGSDEGGTIRIRAARSGEFVEVSVKSPLGTDQLARRPRSGHGQKLVRGRLEAMYADRAELKTQITPDGYVATLSFPREPAP